MFILNYKLHELTLKLQSHVMLFIRIFVPVFIFILFLQIHHKGFSFIITHSNMCDHLQHVAVSETVQNAQLYLYLYTT